MGGDVASVLLAVCLVGARGYLLHDPVGEKDRFLPDAFLRDVVERMGKELNDAASSYVEYPAAERHLAMMARAGKDLENEQLDYDSLLEGNPNPSIRDKEYTQHSSLWGHQYVAGGAGEGPQRLHPSGVIPNKHLVKTDALLPAYCNPPNPCPEGYTEEQDCLMDFENTAGFSRDYQQGQHCMCDGEHMFSCPDDDAQHDDLRFAHLRPERKHLSDNINLEVNNPFLTGERLPIAAKKGFDVNFYDEN